MPCSKLKKYAPMKKSFEKEYGKDKGDKYYYGKMSKMGLTKTKPIRTRKIGG